MKPIKEKCSSPTDDKMIPNDTVHTMTNSANDLFSLPTMIDSISSGIGVHALIICIYDNDIHLYALFPSTNPIALNEAIGTIRNR
jgi:hypothetical protein